MATAYILVGVPGSGKSWYAANVLAKQHPNAVYISTDQYVDAYALGLGKTYSEVFNQVMPRAIQHMIDAVILATTRKQDIIWDQTSTTINSRRKKFNMLHKYNMVAIMFETPPPAELAHRLTNRPNKIIPPTVIESMISNFELPTKSEGFSEIIVIPWAPLDF